MQRLNKYHSSGSADSGEWDNLVPTELAGLPDIPTRTIVHKGIAEREALHIQISQLHRIQDPLLVDKFYRTIGRAIYRPG
jgi:hypothetical protein